MSGVPARNATLARSVRLFRAFRVEQTRPDVFYGELARDSVEQVAAVEALDGARMLDVGGGPGYFADAFRAAGVQYVSVESDLHELSARGAVPDAAVIGSADRLPFGTGAFDIAYSSNVWEHVPDPTRMLHEMVRVVRPGGLVHLSYTVWFGPWGGHETAPWHYLGGAFARRRYARKHGHEPKNRWGESMFALTVRDGLRIARQVEHARLVAAYPRYLPSWATAVVHVPGVREVVTWNLVLLLRKDDP